MASIYLTIKDFSFIKFLDFLCFNDNTLIGQMQNKLISNYELFW